MSPEHLKETKIIKNVLATTVKLKDLFDLLLGKYELHKVLRVSTWVTRFISNCQKNGEKKASNNFRNTISRECECEQRKLKHSEKFEESKKQLNLQLNCEGIYECRALSEKIIMSAQRKTLHG